MIQDLTDGQMEHLLKTRPFGRLGCGSGEKLYIVPLSFVYDGQYIYGHAREGMKIDLMRKHSKVCFQVDEIQNMNEWWSIIIQAEYEELTEGPFKEEAERLLRDRLAIYSPSAALRPAPAGPYMTGHREKATLPIVFRLKIIEKTGKMEFIPRDK